MKAMILNQIHDLSRESEPLQLVDIKKPVPKKGQVLLEVSACGVCHTELDEIEGRTAPPHFPVVPGHQVVGRVVEKSADCRRLEIGTRVGVAWIFSSCGQCAYCREGNDNLCSDFRATGRDVHGGYAEYMTVPEASAFPIPDTLSDGEAAPLLCAGAIGFRSLRLTGLVDGRRLGLTGFGASGHLVLKMALHQYPKSEIYVFARSEKERE